jgi:hypothetical protein
MSSFIIKVENTSNEVGTIIADVGFNYSDKLNVINEANIKISGSSETKRSLIEMGSKVWIYRNGTLEFKGLMDNIDFLEGGGISIHASGWEVWLAKENGDYSGSPWTSTASATIFNAILGECSQPSGDSFTAGTVNAGTTIDFQAELTDSLWNAISNLKDKTQQDIGIDYINQQIDILDHKGSSTTVATFNAGVQISNIRISHSYPIGNDVRVYGKGEGETRIKSDAAQGQDATSKTTYGTIRKIVRDPTVITVAEANILANALVAMYKDPIKIYDFEVMNPNQSLVCGDIITLNAKSQGLSNEEVRIVGIEKGFRGDQEYLTLQVTNAAFSRLVKKKEEVLAEIEKTFREAQTHNQYQSEYSNQHSATCIGGASYFDNLVACLLNFGVIGNGVCGCTGDWFYLNTHLSAPSHTIQACRLNINASSAGNCIDAALDVSGALTIGAYTLPNTDGTSGQVLCTNGSGTVSWGAGGGGGSAYWDDGTNPYIVPCNSCQICAPGIEMIGDISDATSLNKLGTASSPGQFKEVNACCGVFTHCVYGTNLICASVSCGTSCVRGAVLCSTGDVEAPSGTITGQYLNINASAAENCISGNLYVSAVMSGATTCGTTCVRGPIVCGATCVRGGVVCGATCVTSGTGVITHLDGTCVCASRRLRLPVGTNCY